jgi:acyl carrier protein
MLHEYFMLQPPKGRPAPSDPKDGEGHLPSVLRSLARIRGVPASRVDPDLPFEAYDGGPTDRVEALMAAESRLRIEIPDHLADQATTPRRLAGIIGNIESNKQLYRH